MTARARKKPPPRPTIPDGTTFTFRIAPGRIGVCRVLGAHDQVSLYVMIARWNGPEQTSFATMQRAKSFHEPQPHTHHSWGNRLLAGLAQNRIPRSVELAGISEVTKPERALLPKLQTNGAGWTWLLDQAKRQWRWDNEREAVLAADRREVRAQERAEERMEKAAARKRALVAKKGPKALLRRTWFSDFRPVRMRRAARALIAHLLSTLIATTRDEKRDAKLLAKTVVSFNRLDHQFGRSFDTVDAEQIMDALAEIGTACGVADKTFDRVVDGARDF